MIMSKLRASPWSGFTLIELLLVIFVMALLTTMAVPAFSKMVKTSRVQQASKQILTVLWQARSEAERYRDPVVVFFGDDPALLPVQPVPNVLPPKGSMEIWSVMRGLADESNDIGGEPPPYWVENPSAASPDWYPHRAKMQNLTAAAVTLPDQVRVLCGNLYTGNFGGINLDHEFRCDAYRQDSVGEIRRHQVGYGRNGGLALGSYNVIVVYDETSGDYQLIVVSTGGGGTRPKIIPDRIKTIQLAPLNNQMDLPKMLSAITPDR
jgi:prepilin-type N-terminal cleavage/methylation domain-containing protein